MSCAFRMLVMMTLHNYHSQPCWLRKILYEEILWLKTYDQLKMSDLPDVLNVGINLFNRRIWYYRGDIETNLFKRKCMPGQDPLALSTLFSLSKWGQREIPQNRIKFINLLNSGYKWLSTIMLIPLFFNYTKWSIFLVRFKSLQLAIPQKKW